MKKILIAMALVIGFSGSAQALDDFYGHQMAKLCFGRNGTEMYDRMVSSTYCNGYIDGVLNPSSFLLNSLGTKPTFCIPNNKTSLQIQNIIQKFLDDNDHLLHQPVTMLITIAMEREFPCPSKEGNQ